ncbi:NAD(P)-dependent iron-only hydrogenase iron-sulfur protein [Anaerocolumna jejuensis DSM 15929]|jgi:NADP-reducing hydrogenase subunit HndB|uniref:NAD(P)-dependent iron-only hydrogenase iron-sulfur protein n=1 Tax=Anaerocolumna jejuensis DSM 15929 TaxID=1121322 RepID=A0A1M6S2Q4_9FIRM|nr:(2Fe-2S) ferredoxin domain-containing protein [Anaerocolumna jejuensis]SHK39005.1 NAD(P)-dependent iron-only hydrogenase iron-sulfur protein [Anaerocolumna jejuensis DSM 15929]
MKTLEELKAIREKMQGQVGLRSESASQTRVVVGMATCGIASGARPVLTALSDAVQEKSLTNIAVVQTGCIGLCQYEPIVEVFEPGKDKVTYIKMTPEKALEVLEKHLIGGKVVEKYIISSEGRI